MKKLPFFLLGLLFFLTGCHNTKITKLQTELDALCSDAVPDKRIDICECKVEKGEGNTIVIKGEILNPEVKAKILATAGNIHPGIVDSIILLPESSIADKPWGLVTISVANLKTKPSHASEMANQAIMGTPVRILKKDNDWVYVQTPDHYLAWTTGSSLAVKDQAGLENWRNSDRIIFMENYGLVTTDVSGSEIVSDLVAGSILVKKGETVNLTKVVLPDNRMGYVLKKSCRDFKEWLNTDHINPENLVSTAKEFLGLPYFWGGTSSKAVDCSGFVKNIWFLNGIILERDASQQFRHGQVIEAIGSFKNLKSGDVLFFGKTDPLRIVHTGMYIGNGEVIHSAGRVRINSMDSLKPDYSSYLGTTYVGTKRITGQQSQFGYMPVKDHPWY